MTTRKFSTRPSWSITAARSAPGTSAVFKGRMSRADNDEWCTTPGRLAREEGGRAPFSSLGEEATQQRDGAAGTPLSHPHAGIPRLEALLTVVHDPRSPCEDKHWGPYTPSSWSRCSRRRFLTESSCRRESHSLDSTLVHHRRPIT